MLLLLREEAARPPDHQLRQSMKTKGIMEEPIDLKGMAERRNVTHNYKLLGSASGPNQRDEGAEPLRVQRNLAELKLTG
ncbi:hypothetical protein EYF80_036905 [Liparis tanakae]|uniref:Uncharacterized protein n=1 Tax=Liparis tanakae TaxID=230148 RepID=A0A4Z2GJH5_9TELE|nr:hypothetical protein EYF80_036905 [Liparis tanakae]